VVEAAAEAVQEEGEEEESMGTGTRRSTSSRRGDRVTETSRSRTRPRRFCRLWGGSGQALGEGAGAEVASVEGWEEEEAAAAAAAR